MSRRGLTATWGCFTLSRRGCKTSSRGWTASCHNHAKGVKLDSEQRTEGAGVRAGDWTASGRVWTATEETVK
jgi:hypothetical protein